MLEHIPASERGLTQTDWLASYHSFTFGSYLNCERIGYSVLQVLNTDQIKAGKDTGVQNHENIEILSYVTQGVLKHTDSLGNERLVPAGDFQLMSAGAGLSHSESNGSNEEELHFIQMWLIPNKINVRPGYQQKTIARDSNFQLVASHTPRDNAMFLNQDAEVYRFNLDTNRYFYLGKTVDHHQAYIHVVDGELNLSDGTTTLSITQGDGVMCSGVERLEFIKTSEHVAEGLLFVLPSDY